MPPVVSGGGAPGSGAPGSAVSQDIPDGCLKT
jgi:hypothetical protein